ncbi:APC family permease [Ornithinimicrobium sp. Arc0846-15]|nr:APC family permease [Ornithinimicrobium laminariae]
MESQREASTDERPGLRSGRLGVGGIVFFVIAAAAPLVGMTGALPVAIVVGNGAGAPGAYLAVGLVLLLFGVGYARMTTVVTNAGAFFAYVGRGLGTAAGVGSAYVSLVAYLAIQLAIYGFFGAVASGQLAAQWGWDIPWWVLTLAAWAVVFILSSFQVDVGAGVLGVLMILEVASLLLTSAAVYLQGGANGFDFAASFAPGNVFVGGFAGSAGIALAFAFASFIGFEATAIYGEESKDPKRTVPLATYTAITLITLLFAFTSFAVVSALGADQVVERTVELSSIDGVPLADSALVLFAIAEQYVGGWLATTMGWLVISSLFAGLLAFQNSAARYFFAMGRSGALPKGLGQANAVGAPLRGSIVVSVIAGVVIAIFAVTGGDPILQMFFWFSAMAVVAIVLVEILVCAAIVRYFRKNTEGSSPFATLIAPIAAAVGLALGEYLLMSRFGLLAGTVPEGVDPAVEAWVLTPLGYFLVFAPFIALAIGFAVGSVKKSDSKELQDMMR